MPQDDRLTDRVRRGAKWLDRAAGGWTSLVEVATLDMSDPGQCVLAQVFGRVGDAYLRGLTRLSLDAPPGADPYRLAWEHGFEVASPDQDLAPLAYDVLTQAWKAEIESRRFYA